MKILVCVIIAGYHKSGHKLWQIHNYCIYREIIRQNTKFDEFIVDNACVKLILINTITD